MNYLETKYERWIKTKPKSIDRHREVVKTIETFINDGRLIVVPEKNEKKTTESSTNTEIVDKSADNSNTSDKPDNKDKSAKSGKSDESERLLQIPGFSVETILASSFADEFLPSKGLSPEERTFLKEISSFVLRAIKKESLVKIYINNGKNHIEEGAVILKRVDALIRKNALEIGEKQNTVLFNFGLLKELEKGYDKFVLENKELKGDEGNELISKTSIIMEPSKSPCTETGMNFAPDQSRDFASVCLE